MMHIGFFSLSISVILSLSTFDFNKDRLELSGLYITKDGGAESMDGALEAELVLINYQNPPVIKRYQFELSEKPFIVEHHGFGHLLAVGQMTVFIRRLRLWAGIIKKQLS
jgi:hypothetical protein